MKLTARIQKLAAELGARPRDCRFFGTREAGEEFSRILLSVTGRPGESELMRRARFLSVYAESFTPWNGSGDLLAGRNLFGGWREYFPNDRLQDGKCLAPNHGHIIVDYGMLLDLGIPGLRKRIETEMEPGDSREAFLLALNAFSRFVERHAETAMPDIAAVCRDLTKRPPNTFGEALQLVWFTQIFLHVEGLSSAAVSFGRFDRYLGRFTDGSPEDYELLCAFLLKCCEGDESQNLTLGGPGGENLLAQMVLEAMRELNLPQPSISVRFSPASSTEFRHAAFRLAANGSGQPAFFNDPVICRSLKYAKIPAERVHDWGIVGCYEASPQGDCAAFTVAMGESLPALLLEFLEIADQSDFDRFYAEFKLHLKTHYLEKMLPRMRERLETFGREQASPFESLCLGGCIGTGLPAGQGGSCCRLFGVQFMGLGTVVDSLLALKRQLPPDGARRMEGKFGSDSSFTNHLAADLAGFLGRLVLAGQLPGGFQPNPGLFWFGQDIRRRESSTPDGRRENEPVSYGCGPGHLLRRSEPTAILNSLAALPHELFSNGAPCQLTLSGPAHLEELVDGYFARGGSHLAFNLVDSSTLEEAIEHPELHSSLMVKISGYSARFVDLDRQWQQALLLRSRKGI